MGKNPEFKEDLYMPGKTQGIVSMVCGLVSIFGSYSFGVGIIIAIVGLVMNSKAVAAGYQGTPVKVGKITSIIGLILSIANQQSTSKVTHFRGIFLLYF